MSGILTTVSPLGKLYQEFRTLVGIKKDDPKLKDALTRVKGLAQDQMALVGELFDLSLQAQEKRWSEIAPKVQKIRQRFQDLRQEKYLALVFCVAFNALFTKGCQPKECKEIGVNFITDCLCLGQNFAMDPLNGLSQQEQVQLVCVLSEALADFSDVALLERHHERLAFLFPLWQRSKALFIEGKEIPIFRALLQFPDPCWKQFSQEEKTKLGSIIAEFRQEMNFMEFKGLNKFSEDKEWTPHLTFLREVGQVYRLATYLKLTDARGVEAFFPGFSAAFVQAGAPYVSCLKNTATQAAFCKRLVETSIAMNSEKDFKFFDAFHNLFEVIAQLHVNAAQMTEAQAFRFLAQYHTMTEYFVPINGEFYHQLSMRVSNLLIIRGVPAGLGVLGLLTAFFAGDHSTLSLPYLETLFQALAGAIDLDKLSLDMQENIAKGALRVVKEGSAKGDAYHLLPLFTPKIPSYYAVLIQRIESIYSAAGYLSVQKLLAVAETHYQELKIEMGMHSSSNAALQARMAMQRLKGQIKLLEDLLAKAAEWKKQQVAKRAAEAPLMKIEDPKKTKEERRG